MAFVEAKCPACGGTIQLDDANETGFCMYCGTKVLLNDSIPRRVKVDGIQTLEQRLKNAETYAKLSEIDKAITLLTQITEEFTSDYHAWWILAKLKYAYGFYYENEDAGLIDKIESSKEYKYCKILLEENKDKDIESEYSKYVLQISTNINNSQKKIEATITGDYTYINHCYQNNKGYEVIDDDLYFWELMENNQGTYMILIKTDIRELNILSIHNKNILFQDGKVFIMSNEVSESYLRCRQTSDKQEKKQRIKVGLLLAAFAAVFVFLILVAIFS
ncbi:MAG: hypothetical protein GX417_04615 [Clostridiales bacterium]|nr:hypothetical protein [Clostridiales bacterium]